MEAAQELMIATTREADCALPVNVVPKHLADYANGLVAHVERLKITDKASYKEAAAVFNDVHKIRKSLDEKRLELGRDYDAAKEANVNEPVKALLAALAVAKAKAGNLISAEDARIEAERKQQELEKQQAREKAEAMRLEAERRKDVAESKVVAATTDGQFHKAADAFDKGVAVAAEAEQVVNAVLTAPKVEAPKAAGLAKNQTVEDLEVTNLAALAITYHQPDLAKIKRHILDGTLKQGTPGITFTLKIKPRATGK